MAQGHKSRGTYPGNSATVVQERDQAQDCLCPGDALSHQATHTSLAIPAHFLKPIFNHSWPPTHPMGT